MKKILTLLLCLLVSFTLTGLFVSCGKSLPAAKDTTVDSEQATQAHKSTTATPAITTKAPAVTTEAPPCN